MTVCHHQAHARPYGVGVGGGAGESADKGAGEELRTYLLDRDEYSGSGGGRGVLPRCGYGDRALSKGGWVVPDTRPQRQESPA